MDKLTNKPLPKVAEGYKRFYYRCKSCKNVCYRDAVPYSLSNPLMELPCGCLITSTITNHLESITRIEFYRAYRREYYTKLEAALKTDKRMIDHGRRRN